MKKEEDSQDLKYINYKVHNSPLFCPYESCYIKNMITHYHIDEYTLTFRKPDESNN